MSFYSEYYLSKKCDRSVNKIWTLDNSAQTTPIENKLILPNGCFNLAIVSGIGIEVYTKNSPIIMDPGVYFCSQMTNTVSVTIKPNTKVVIVQLHAWLPSVFPEFDLSDFIDSIIKINPKQLPFQNKIDASFFHDTEALLAIIRKNIEELHRAHPSKKEVENICDYIKIHPDEIKASKLAAYLNTSQRTLQIKFKKATGLTIKHYIKILQLRKAIDNLVYTESDTTNLTDIALSNAYFDQSHFTKTFKEIAGVTPKEFNPNLFVLSKKR